MNRARSFFFVCLGILALALAYHLGARSAGAQVGNTVTGIAWFGQGQVLVMTQNGDCYVRTLDGPSFNSQLSSVGNFWSGGATPAKGISIGQLKARYAK